MHMFVTINYNLCVLDARNDVFISRRMMSSVLNTLNNRTKIGDGELMRECVIDTNIETIIHRCLICFSVGIGGYIVMFSRMGRHATF